MAIPTGAFDYKYGIAVMLYNAGASDWFFLGWATKSSFICELGTGTHTVQLWLICGPYSSAGSISYQGVCTVAIANFKK